jgi:hypothetical protein
MGMVAAIGALTFELVWVGHGRVPEFDLRPVAVAGGVELGMARYQGQDLLVLDHRGATDGIARVECWTPMGPFEGAPPDLLLIADARAGAVPDKREPFERLGMPSFQSVHPPLSAIADGIEAERL